MTIAPDRLARVEKIAAHLATLSDSKIDHIIETGDILKDPNFSATVEKPYGQFYAPFDWTNERADVVLIGITPGRKQARTAIKALRAALEKGKSPAEAAAAAKQAASFEGDMREIATLLMDRFDLHRLFKLKTCADLFGSARHRAHYTSILRYPVLHWQTKKPKNKPPVTGWFDYSGGDSAFKAEMLVRSLESDFEREMNLFGKAWLVPFGPTPARALERLVRRGKINPDRVLPGINHPSGTQWNRHNCQLNTSTDHSRCTRNVGCPELRSRSAELEKVVAERLAS